MSLDFFPESIERDLTISFSSDFKSVNMNSIVKKFIKMSWRYSKDSKWWKVRLQKSGKFEFKHNLLPIPSGDFKYTSSRSRYVICNLGWSSILMSDAEISKPFGKSCGFSLYNIDHKDDIHGSNAPSYLHKKMKARLSILFEIYYENNIISSPHHFTWHNGNDKNTLKDVDRLPSLFQQLMFPQDLQVFYQASLPQTKSKKK